MVKRERKVASREITGVRPVSKGLLQRVDAAVPPHPRLVSTGEFERRATRRTGTASAAEPLIGLARYRRRVDGVEHEFRYPAITNLAIVHVDHLEGGKTGAVLPLDGDVELGEVGAERGGIESRHERGCCIGLLKNLVEKLANALICDCADAGPCVGIAGAVV